MHDSQSLEAGKKFVFVEQNPKHGKGRGAESADAAEEFQTKVRAQAAKASAHARLETSRKRAANRPGQWGRGVFQVQSATPTGSGSLQKKKRRQQLAKSSQGEVNELLAHRALLTRLR